MSRNRLYILVLILSIAGYILVTLSLTVPEIAVSDKSLCIIKNVTGIPCPACGTTRSVSALFTGNFRTAFNLNPFGYIAAFALLVLPVVVLVDIYRNKNHIWNLYRKIENQIRSYWVAGILTILVIANWVWNIIKGL